MTKPTMIDLRIHTVFASVLLSTALGAPALGGCDSEEETSPSTGASGSSTGQGGGGTGGTSSTGATGGTGDAGGAGGGSGSTAWEGYCTDIVERETMCDPDNPPSPTLDECVAAEPCFDAIFREGAREPLMECLRARPCDKSDDACFAEVAAGMDATPEQQAYTTACADKLAACAGGFSNDWCSGGDVPWPLFTNGIYAELSGCFMGTCDQVADCLEAALDAKVAPCGGEIGF